MAGLGALFRILSATMPSVAARLAGKLWFRIPSVRQSDAAREVLKRGAPFDVGVGGRRARAWRWGEGPLVVLMHGWGGHAGQFHALVDTLRATNEVIAFDALSHGASDAGSLGRRYGTLFEFAEVLRAVIAASRRPVGLVAHSGGCAAVAWAMLQDESLRPVRTVFVAPFGRPLKYMARFRDALGLSDAALARFQLDTERQFRFRWSDLDVPAMAARMQTPPLLVVHDRGDRETDWQDGADIAAAWPGARLLSTDGLGHNRVLRDPAVGSAIAEFLRGETAG